MEKAAASPRTPKAPASEGGWEKFHFDYYRLRISSAADFAAFLISWTL